MRGTEWCCTPVNFNNNITTKSAYFKANVLIRSKYADGNQQRNGLKKVSAKATFPVSNSLYSIYKMLPNDIDFDLSFQKWQHSRL
jgi:hypothetical protein